MNNEQQAIVQQIADLLGETGKKHHEAFIEVNGDDPEWGIWYAEYLIDKLPSLLNATLTRSEIVYLLIRCEREMALNAPGAKWTHYYARELVKWYR